MRGRFLVLEGPDGSGTTLHTSLLADFLSGSGVSCVRTAEPTAGPVGTFIRGQLRGQGPVDACTLQLLFCADRAWHVANAVEPALAGGSTVVSDRYALSTLAYGEALGLDAAWLERVNAGFPKPDRVVLLLPPLDVCLARLRERGETDAMEKEDLQARVHAAYARLARDNPEIAVIDSSGEKEETARLVRGAAGV